MQVSKYITLKEATESNTAIRNGIKNIPTVQEVERMEYVAKNLFDKIREHFGVPIQVNSFFRSKELNDKVGSNDRSFHRLGSAIDIKALSSTGITNADIFNYVKNNCDFTELIWEYGDKSEPSWVHIALVKGRDKEKAVKYIGV
jgi:zinc D-Ala-D-Ala carboxypeptidase